MKLQLIEDDGKVIGTWKIGKSREADGEGRQYDFYIDDIDIDEMAFEDVWLAMRDAAGIKTIRDRKNAEKIPTA